MAYIPALSFSRGKQIAFWSNKLLFPLDSITLFIALYTFRTPKP